MVDGEFAVILAAAEFDDRAAVRARPVVVIVGRGRRAGLGGLARFALWTLQPAARSAPNTPAPTRLVQPFIMASSFRMLRNR